jgi:Ca2+-binding EF-hand superfamily protein
MGNKAGSANAKQPTKLTKKDYDFLTHATGQQKAQIDAVFNEFNANNPDGKLDKNEFIRLYDKLRAEPPELLDEISVFVFRTFDKDLNGFISFHEFMVAYSLTTRG